MSRTITTRAASRPFKVPLAAFVALTVLAIAAPAAQGYRLGGKRWPGRTIATITYHNATPYKAEVRAAVRAWNASGVRIRFRAVSARRARVRVISRGSDCFGRANVGYSRYRRATIMLGRGCAFPSSMAQTATHEFGHILGLDHEDRGCAAMNSSTAAHCEPQPYYAFRCRLLETDDVRGAIRRYGGRARPVRPYPFCPVFGSPQAPGGLTITLAGTALQIGYSLAEPVRLVADPGPAPHVELFAWRFPGACPPGLPAGPAYRSQIAGYGPQASVIDYAPEPGTWCYAVRTRDYLGRLSDGVVNVPVLVPGPAPPPGPPKAT